MALHDLVRIIPSQTLCNISGVLDTDQIPSHWKQDPCFINGNRGNRDVLLKIDNFWLAD